MTLIGAVDIAIPANQGCWWSCIARGRTLDGVHPAIRNADWGQGRILAFPFRNSDYQPEAIYLVPISARMSPLPMGWSPIN